LDSFQNHKHMNRKAGRWFLIQALLTASAIGLAVIGQFPAISIVGITLLGFALLANSWGPCPRWRAFAFVGLRFVWIVSAWVWMDLIMAVTSSLGTAFWNVSYAVVPGVITAAMWLTSRQNANGSSRNPWKAPALGWLLCMGGAVD
jgi:hypothetical protein